MRLKVGLVLLLLYGMTLFADEEMAGFIADFRAKAFEKVCQQGLERYYGGRQDEMFIMMVGSACAKVDNINPLGILQRHLVSTRDARETASYFSTLVLQKRLIYQFMIDGTPLQELHLPYSNHILSVIFEQIANESYFELSEEPRVIKIIDGDKIMLLSLSEDEPKRVIVKEQEGEQVIREHWFQ